MCAKKVLAIKSEYVELCHFIVLGDKNDCIIYKISFCTTSLRPFSFYLPQIKDKFSIKGYFLFLIRGLL